LFDVRFGTEGWYEVAACEGCGLRQTVPRPSLSELGRLYEEHYNFAAAPKRHSLYERLRERFLASPAYALWRRIDGDASLHGITGAGRLLDVGCNEGRSLEIYGRLGFDAEGLEPNRAAAAKARARGFVVHGGTLGELGVEEHFDVVVLANVLEHTPDPLRTLRAVFGVLKPGGRAWLSVPNLDSFARRLFKRSWINWHVPFHLTHFSPRTLGVLVEKAGFRIASLRTVTPSVWLAQSCVAALASRPGRMTPGLRSPWIVPALSLALRATLFPLLMAANLRRWGDCLLVGAIRPPAEQAEASR
jgi:SAM-dependent methyltransferase